jgi:NAD(P)-dependent dehydrogenase (short-subunit alcohol dehydrogenase family)
MKNEVNGRVVVITGASSGIGRATALRFAKAGDAVVVAARRKRVLNDLVDECERLGSTALAVETDVSNDSSVEKLANTAIKRFGRIDIWVNDAGVGAAGKFDEVPVDEHRRVIETNLNGTIYGSHAAMRQFRQQDHGVLINISSVLGKVTQPYMSSYCASKHGVRALSASVRQELWLDGQEDIHVCTVFPQSIDTPFFQHGANYSGYKIKPAPPIETPENVAEAIFQLADEPQDEVHVGKMGQFVGLQQRISRRLTEKQMAKMAQKGNFDRARHQKPTSGILWEPDKSAGDIRGGWKDGSSGIKKPISAVAVAAPALLGLYVVLKKRKSSQIREVA